MTDPQNWLVNHTGIGVSDIRSSSAFYQAAPEPIGTNPLVCISGEMGVSSMEDPNFSGVGVGLDYPVFWLDVFHPHGVRQHTGFRAQYVAQVDAFHRFALEAGGNDNGAPGLRAVGYTEGYYAAFVLDPDGNNVEAVFRQMVGYASAD